MDLHQDGSATVTEHIDVQFYENRHGIYREIPLVGNVPVDVSNINVDQVFRTEKTNTQASIRIGDPAKYVNGLVSYSISYDVYGALIPFSGGQELYRNLIGTNRDTTIQDIDFEIHFPTKVELNQQKIYFYYGAVGAKNSEAVSFTYDQDALIGELQTVLNPYEGLTIGIEFPDSYFTLDTERLATLQQQSKQYYTPTSGPISSRNR